MKKALIPLFLIVLATTFASANSISIEFSQGNEFEAGDTLTFKTTLYDDSGNPLDGKINLLIQDGERNIITEKTVDSKDFSTIELGDKVSSGQGVITATSGDTKAIEFFEVGKKELARFDLEGNILKVTNIGNTPYSRVIKITIGETTGTKEPELDIGESISYRLVAPEGTYNIKVDDGITTLTRGDIPLSGVGTGQAIGAIDNSAAQRSPLTGIASPDENSDIALLSYIKNNTFVYVFILVIFAATILLAIERKYRHAKK